MKSWKDAYSLVFLLFCASGFHTSQAASIGAETNRSAAIALQEHQRVSFGESRFGLACSVSVSGRVASIFSLDKGMRYLFQFLESQNMWHGPYIWPMDSLEARRLMLRWQLTPDDEDVLYETSPPHRSFRLIDGVILQMQEPVETILPTFELGTSRLVSGSRPTIADLVSLPSFAWAKALLQEEQQEAQERIWESVRADNMVLDVAPDHKAILCLVDPLMRRGPMRPVISVDADGEVVEYWPANGRPRDYDQGATAQYSPDGRFVMVNFCYRDDGDVFTFQDKDGRERGMPGTVQIFTREGVFQAEVLVHEYRDDCPTSYAQAYWLRDDWIVYTSPYDLVFVKVLHDGRPCGAVP